MAKQDANQEPLNSILARKIGRTAQSRAAPPEGDAPATPMRQMRRALGRAADRAVGLSASVLGIAEEELDSEEMIESGPEGWVVLGLRGAGTAGLCGVFLLDPALRSALVEMQTMGNLLPAGKDERAVTGTDALMCVPFADQLLKQLALTGFGAEEFDLAAYDMGPIEDLRTAGLVLLQGSYRCWRITVQVGGGDRQGDMMIALRCAHAERVVPDNTADWAQDLRRALSEAPAEMDAILARTVLPIRAVEAFEVGQVLHLAGVTVGSVSLTGPDGKTVATARLGQVAGKRAVRIEPMHLHLQDDLPKRPTHPDQNPALEGADGPQSLEARPEEILMES